MSNSSTRRDLTERPPAGEPRVVRFDRQLAAGLAGLRPGWGDPQIDRLVAEAAERAREEGRAQGYAAGWAQGRQAAAERERAESQHRAAQARARAENDAARVDIAIAQLARASGLVNAAAAPAWHDLADTLADGVLDLARALLGRELATVDGEAVQALRTALRSLADTVGLVIHAHPEDAALLASVGVGELPDGARIVSDPSVPAGAVQAATPTQHLLVHLPAALRRAREALTG